MNHEIPLSENQKAFLANGIFRAVSQDLPEIIYENNLPTTNGSGLFRWNFINKNLSDGLGGEFETSFPKRGAWKFLILHEQHSNFSITVMTEPTLKNLQRHPKSQPHYLEGLVCNNKHREPIEGQLCIPELCVEHDPTILMELRNQLLSGFSGIIKEHMLILFDYDYTGVTSARAVLLTPSLEVAVSENWTKYLKSTYISHQSALIEVLPDDEPMAKLKAEYIKDDELTALHQEEPDADSKTESTVK